MALDTCGAATTLALGCFEDGHLARLREASLLPRTAGQQLTVALRTLLGDQPASSLRAIVVVRGPGSFTGMRIGLSAAKALSQVAGVPLFGVSRLAVLASGSGAGSGVLDAGRGRVYWGTVAGPPELLTAEEARGRVAGGAGGPVAVCEDAAEALFAGCATVRRVREPTAADALASARDRLLAGDSDDRGALDALYVWRPEQMLRRAEGAP